LIFSATRGPVEYHPGCPALSYGTLQRGMSSSGLCPGRIGTRPAQVVSHALPASSHVQMPSTGGGGRTARLAGRAVRARRRFRMIQGVFWPPTFPPCACRLSARAAGPFPPPTPPVAGGTRQRRRPDMPCDTATPAPLGTATALPPEDRPRIYVACLAAYNNGCLHGRWIDATTPGRDHGGGARHAGGLADSGSGRMGDP
jgi:hypothetical protein